MVLSISPEKVVTAVSREDGLFTVEAGAVILAMGCRERSRGLEYPRLSPGGRVLRRHGAAHVNMEGYMPGREVVILGSGDIGLIMAPHDVRGREKYTSSRSSSRTPAASSAISSSVSMTSESR